MDEDEVAAVAGVLRDAVRIVFFTGAGVSTDLPNSYRKETGSPGARSLP